MNFSITIDRHAGHVGSGCENRSFGCGKLDKHRAVRVPFVQLKRRRPRETKINERINSSYICHYNGDLN